MTAILHISYDLRNPKGRETTSAVRALIDASSKHTDAAVVDVVRVAGLAKEKTRLLREGHLQIDALGLPFGLFLIRHLQRVLLSIQKAGRHGLIDLASVDLIHAHKLTFEGHIGAHLAGRLDVPLIVTLRQTDFYVFKYRPDLRPHYKRILAQCRFIFYLLPVMKDFLRRYVGGPFFERHVENKMVFLPNMVARLAGPPTNPKKRHLLTIARMTPKSAKRKNLKRLFKAIAGLDARLTVVGGGDYFETVKSWPRKYGVQDKVLFVGQIPNGNLYEYFAQACAFVLPSLSESFGMSYAEALLCGTPILYSRGVLGFDGVFEDVGTGVDPRSVSSIADGLGRLIENNDRFRQAIAALDRRHAFDIFDMRYICNRYMQCVHQACSRDNQVPAPGSLQLV